MIIRNIMSCAARKSRSGRMRQLAAVLVAALVMNQTAPLFTVLAQASVEGADNSKATSSVWSASPSDTGEDDTDDTDGENKDSGENRGPEIVVATPGNMPAAVVNKPMLMSMDAGDTIHIEAEDYYGNHKTTDDGTGYADLQPDTEISIPLSNIDGFAAGKYLIRIRYGGNAQTLVLEAGSISSQVSCPDIGFDGFTDDSETECLDVIALSNSDTLKLKACTAVKYGWVDWIELEPTDAKRIRVQAKDYVSPGNSTTGDDGNCANMDPGVKVEWNLGSDFEDGQYALLLTSVGNARSYTVQVSGTTRGSYDVTAADWGTQYLHDDGFQGTYNLKSGQTVTILAPEGSYGWLKDVVLQWVGELPDGYEINNGVYTFQAESYSDTLTDDGAAAKVAAGSSLSIDLSRVNNFKAGAYSVQIRYAGKGQKLIVDTGKTNGRSEFFVPEKNDLQDAVTAEGLEIVELAADDVLSLKPEAEEGVIDWVRLTPDDSKRKRLTPQECNTTKFTSDGKYANMDPGESMTVTLDDSFDRGTYRLLMTGTGSERAYLIQINGEAASEPSSALTYQATGAAFRDDQIHDDGWQELGELNKGDTIKISAPANETDKFGWVQDVVLEWEPAGSGAGMQGDAYVFEAEAYYSQLTGDGQGADFQENDELKIYLSDAVNFKAGNYLVQIVYAGNGQVMPMTIGNASSEMIFSPASFSWEGMTAESMEVFLLDGSEVLTLRASAGKYTWIDKILLVPTDENRIRLNVSDSIVKADAVAGDNGNCANMDPGTSVTMTLDDRFGSGQYELLLFHAGFARNYSVLVNGQEADSYQAAGNGSFGTDQLLSNGWQGYYELKPGDTVTIKAPGSDAGWIKDIVWQGTAPRFYQKDEETGIIAEADEGVVPVGTRLSVKALGKVGEDYFSDENMRAAGYRIELIYDGQVLDLTAEGREDAVQVTIPLPAGFDKENGYLDLFYQDGGSWESMFAGSAANGNALTATMQGCGVYAVSMEKGIYHYEAEHYYNAWSDDGNAANFETGNGASIRIPLEKKDGFDRGVYNLLVRYCGGGSSSLTVKTDGKWTGSVPVTYTGDDSWGSYRLAPAEGVLELYSSNVLELAVPKNQYHWIDYVRLVEAESFEETVDGVNAKAEVGSLPVGAHLAVEDASAGDAYLEELHDRFRLGNITAKYIYFYWDDDTESRISPATAVKVRMVLPSGMDEGESYCLYYLSGSGQGIRCTKVPSTIENGELVFSITKETGLFALVEGAAILPAGFDSEEIYGRTGARVSANAERAATEDEVKAAGVGKNKVVKTRTEGSHYYYEGEAYYKAQSDSLTGDLQPGAQIQIRLSDNSDFRSGSYTLTVRSNGNRQKLIVKVNNRTVGNVLRAETSFDMMSMTEDTMAGILQLSPADLLTIEGETGGYYGWIDYVELAYVSPYSGGQTAGKTVAYKGAEHYGKQADGCIAADLQPGDTLSFRAGDNESFEEGDYQIAVTSNGNRTRLWVKVNGGMMGSIVRAAGSGFGEADFTTDVMNHTLHLRADDVISLEAPGNAEDGPYGWIETVCLIPAPEASGERKAEYRYDGEDFYKASLYSPAADLQPAESIVIPVSNDPDFEEGNYRLSVLSNGTRERFDVRVNDVPVGIIRRKATDYSEIDYSQDYLEALLALKPGDVLTLTGQDGDFYGWVNYILLEQADR